MAAGNSNESNEEKAADRTLSSGDSLSGAPPYLRAPATAQLVGTTFDSKYEILELLGQGGMSAVYKAKNLMLNRIVAIKLLLGNHNFNEQLLMRFQQEARATSHLDHQGIVKVHDFSVAQDNTPYMVMDYVQGNSIADIIAADGPLEPYRAIDLILQACAALHHAHQQGVVHRDLKPSNIMVVELKDGSELAKIVDFGVAKLLEDEQSSTPHLTKTGDVFGSPLYMSPEQCLGKKVDARSDIYSLACVLFEELTGAPPFRADNLLSTMNMHVTQAPPELSKSRENLHNGALLSSILLKALAKSPEERYQSMGEFAHALNEAALKPGAGLFDRWKTQLKILRQTRGSNRTLLTIAACGAAALLLVIAYWFGSQSHTPHNIQSTITAAPPATPTPPLVPPAPTPPTVTSSDAQSQSLSKKPTDSQLARYLEKFNPVNINVEDGMFITNVSIPLLIKETNLSELYLRRVGMDAAGCKELTRGLGKQLEKLSFTGSNQLEPDDLIEILHNCPNLVQISLQGMRTDDRVVAAMAKYKALRCIEVSASDITGRVFENFPVMKTVSLVMVNNSSINGQTLRDIARAFPNLQSLHMKNTHIKDSELEPLKKLPLKSLWIYRCNLSDQALEDLQKAVGRGLAIHRTQ